MAEGGYACRLDHLEARIEALEKRLEVIEGKLGLDKMVPGQGEDSVQAQNELRLTRVERAVQSKELYSTVAGKGRASRVAARAIQRVPLQVLAPLPAPRPVPVSVRSGTSGEEADQWKGLRKGAVTVMGSSMVRGVGQHLENQSHFCDSICYPGARIEDITRKVQLLKDKPDSHMVFMVGTNNLVNDQHEVMLEKYGKLIATVKEKKFRKASIVSILERADKWMHTDRREFIDCKRIGMNLDLAEMCAENGLEFVDVGIDAESMLTWKGLHLNERGQDFVAERIFKHCRKYLN